MMERKTMSKFNKNKKGSKPTASHEGGLVYDKKLENEWINILFSSFLEPGYYIGQKDRQNRFIELTKLMMDKYGIGFVAKAARYSRNVLGIRSISHLTAAMVNDQQFEGKRDFYKSYFHRPDDVAEVFSAVDMLDKKRSHGLVRGACDYLSGLNDYQMGKYKLSGKEFSMFDLINITHANSNTVDRYKNGTLPVPETWETVISSADDKAAAWQELVRDNKLGYMALIRNLRNIIQTNPSKQFIEVYLIPAIENETAIRKSLIYPYQIYNAYKMLHNVIDFRMDIALSNAFNIAIGNMPNLDGNSLVVLDVSGSMDSKMSKMSNVTIKEVGSVYAACIAISNPTSDIIIFGTNAKKVDNNIREPFKLIDMLNRNHHDIGCGTDMIPVFDIIDKSYDRMFLISDMQVMDDFWSGEHVNNMFNKFRKEYGPCHMYSFDLGGYGTQVLKTGSNDISYITALNDNVFKFIQMQESGKTLIDFINEYTY